MLNIAVKLVSTRMENCRTDLTFKSIHWLNLTPLADTGTTAGVFWHNTQGNTSGAGAKQNTSVPDERLEPTQSGKELK
ncbi:hypothetical protein C0J52_26344 [Blattella germanica]|nr:hypothetical protein C0J52_26344 [Blattella germanica]